VIHFNSGIRHSEFVGNKLALLTDKNDLIFIDLDKAIN
jgi:predicted Ser/Thr protein kinase